MRKAPLLALLLAPLLAWAQPSETTFNNFGSAPVYLITNPLNGQCLVYQSSTQKWINATCSAATGTVTSVGFSVPATSIFTATGSPVTSSGTLGLTTTGTSGGIPYFSSTSALSSSGALTASALVLGGGAGAAPTVVSGLGTSTQVLHGNAAGAPAFSALVAGDLPSNPSLTNSLWTFNFTSQSANTDIDTIIGANTTPAATAAQQYACIHLQAFGWKTTATAASQAVDWRICDEPVQGAAAPTGNLLLEVSIGGGAYAVEATLTSIGGLGIAGNLSSTPGTGLAFMAGFRNANGTAGISFIGGSTGLPQITAASTIVQLWGGTAFTVTGCGAAGSIVAHGTTGKFTVGTGAVTCTFVFTINGASGLTAPHGWIANVDDVTANLHCLNNGTIASTTTATVLCNSVVTTGDLITAHFDPF